MTTCKHSTRCVKCWHHKDDFIHRFTCVYEPSTPEPSRDPIAIGEAYIIVSTENGKVRGSFPDTKAKLGYTNFELLPVDAVTLGELLLKHGREAIAAAERLKK